VASLRQAGKDTGAQRSADVTAPAKAPGAENVSAPGRNLGQTEPTERLRPALTHKAALARVQSPAAPGQELQYRARVGGYAERTAADQTAQHLTAQEQVPAIVAGRD
jgi:hypothetical protein